MIRWSKMLISPKEDNLGWVYQFKWSKAQPVVSSFSRILSASQPISGLFMWSERLNRSLHAAPLLSLSLFPLRRLHLGRFSSLGPYPSLPNFSSHIGHATSILTEPSLLSSLFSSPPLSGPKWACCPYRGLSSKLAPPTSVLTQRPTWDCL